MIVQTLVVHEESVGRGGCVRIAEVAATLQERGGQAEAASNWTLISYKGDATQVSVVYMHGILLFF